ENFQELKDFVSVVHFEKVGTFVYSKEEGTPAFEMKAHVPETIKRQRMHDVMSLQKDISEDIQHSCVGRRLKVLIDEKQKETEGIYLGRSEYDAPEVDGIVYVHTERKLKAGDFVDVVVDDALEYDLVGHTV
ncbi:MAG: 30S ribosomal protein S12 methylthiotransferase RimO, partial [Candidatus Omnitrophica bacterium CG12_big_fil_rev_8_21_14_0_65_50_5]